MRVILAAVLLLIITSTTFAQRQGIGIRIGDPLGVSYKRYLGMKAFEFGLGSSSQGMHKAYYRNSFESHSRFDDADYISHSVRSTIYLNGRYLIHNAIHVDGMEGKWDWYWGLGAMLKFATVRYRYNDVQANQRETFHDIDLGPEGIAGMEYTFQDVPVSVFADVSLMLEIVNRVTLRPFGGVGVRYNF